MIYLYDPITNISKQISYDRLSGITGKTKEVLRSMKSRKMKIKSINCYITDETITLKQRQLWINSENIENEYWRPIKIKSVTKYYISDYGRVKAIYPATGKEKILMQYLKKATKALIINFNVDGKRKQFAVHKLVADAFLEKESEKVIYHKDENRYNNRASNLAYIERNKGVKKWAKKSKSIPVLKIDPYTFEVVDEYESIAEASRDNFVCREAIRCAIRSKQKTSAGYIWEIDTERYETYYTVRCGG